MAHVPAERCLSIIELLADGASSMSLGEVAERLQLPKSATHRLLSTLVDCGWAEQDTDTAFYRLTMRLATLGQQFYVASGIPDVCQPLLDRLARECGDFARLSVLDGDALVWVAHSQGATRGLVYQPSLASNTVPLYATATGKAWLATMDLEEALRKVRKHGGFKTADRYGPNVIRSEEALLREIKATARRGYGTALSEAEPGVNAVAAAIRSQRQDRAVGTVSIAGPSVRMTDKRIREIAPAIIHTAAEMAALWPLRPRAQAGSAPGNVARAA